MQDINIGQYSPFGRATVSIFFDYFKVMTSFLTTIFCYLKNPSKVFNEAAMLERYCAKKRRTAQVKMMTLQTNCLVTS